MLSIYVFYYENQLLTCIMKNTYFDHSDYPILRLMKVVPGPFFAFRRICVSKLNVNHYYNQDVFAVLRKDYEMRKKKRNSTMKELRCNSVVLA